MPKTGENEGLLEDTHQEVTQIGTADVVLGLPTYNNRETVSNAAEAGVAALDGHLAGKRLVIINADGGSSDGTAEHLREMLGGRLPLVQVRYPVYPVDRLSSPLAGVPGRREAALAIFQQARQLQAKACVLLDAQVETVTADWIERLAQPVLDGSVDLVVPQYLRHAFDGLINSGLVSPFTRALFGRRLRQPSGADLAFSAALMDFYLEPDAVASPPLPASDPWSTITALVDGFRIGHTFLGPRRVEPRGVAPDLAGTLETVLTILFDRMERSAAFWQKVRGSEPVPWFGPPFEIESECSEINRKPMIDSFRQGCHDLVGLWRLVLPPATLLELHRTERQADSVFRFADDLWARVIYDFALGYHLRVMGRDHLLRAIVPLYLGWAASFIGEMEQAAGSEVEERFERLSIQFEGQKRYFISRWRWPDQFNP